MQRLKFSEPVHVGRIYIGGKTRGIAGRVAVIAGGMPAYDARGI